MAKEEIGNLQNFLGGALSFLSLYTVNLVTAYGGLFLVLDAWQAGIRKKDTLTYQLVSSISHEIEPYLSKLASRLGLKSSRSSVRAAYAQL